MKKSPLNALKHLCIISLSLVILGGVSNEFGKEKPFFHGFLIQKPIIDIGLGINLSQINISSSAGMKIYEVKTNYTLISDDADEVLIKGNREKVTEKYVIQVARARDREEAERTAQDLRVKIDRKVFVKANEQPGIDSAFKVMVGDFQTRDDALNYMAELNQLGESDTWIFREEVTEKESKPLWILINDELKSLDENTILYFIPSGPQSFLSYKGRNYRGIFTLRASRRGIVLVNTLNLDDYLKAVVPSELSPYDFPEIEALKAQAVAARTYALKNLGQYKYLGFDLDDTPNSQFYKGLNAEHPQSSLAVEQTKGEVAKYDSKLIDALYTSTCGGATEDVENVFLGPALPYLRSTDCLNENQVDWPLRVQNTVAPIYVKSQSISADVAWLISLGVLPREIQPAYYIDLISGGEALDWIQNARTLLGKPSEPDLPILTKVNLGHFVHLAVKAFDWQERVSHLLFSGEKEFILGSQNGWSEEISTELAYFLQAGIIPSRSEVEQSSQALTRGELAFYLARILRTYQDFFKQGQFKGMEQNQIMVEVDEEIIPLTLPASAFLAQAAEGHHAFVLETHLLGGETLRWIENKDQIQLLEVVYPAFSNILDRSSKYHSWQIRQPRSDLSDRINQFYPVGELQEITPIQRGASNRVVEMVVKGSESQVTVKGLRIRRILGLRETLFVIDREYDEQGGVSYFTFTGKGWGHGVGLCQVGAFGMAQSGADYKEILSKYYQGIQIDKIY